MTAHEAVLLFSYPEPIAEALVGALAPEASLAEVPKTRAEITRAGGEVRVRVLAEDLAALRAAVNSYARWVEAGARAAGAAERG